MDIKQLARQRIAEAEAAIAAAGKSAMSTYHTEGFRTEQRMPVPWASAYESSPAQPSQFPTSFAERLKLHEAHLNALKQASKMPPLQRIPLAPAAQPRTFSSLSDPAAPSLPPWSQPHHMPTFRRTRQSDPSLASAKSCEGSRVSTAGSGATIGWAGPWVVTHRQGGPDRMYPAQLRPDVSKDNSPQRPASKTSAAPGQGSLHAPADQAITSSSKQPTTQPMSVEWLLPHRHSQVPPAGHLSAAPAAHMSARYGFDTNGTASNLEKRMHGIPSAPAAGSPAGSAWRAHGSNIPSPVRKAAQNRYHQQHQPLTDANTQPPGAERTQDAGAAHLSTNPQGREVEAIPYKGYKCHPAADKDPPFRLATNHSSDHSRHSADALAQPDQRSRFREQAQVDLQTGHSQGNAKYPPRPIQKVSSNQGASATTKGREAATDQAATTFPKNSHHETRASQSIARVAVCSGGGGQATASSRGTLTPCGGGASERGPQERSSDLSAPIARLKRLLRTRSNESSPSPASVEEWSSAKSTTDRLHGRSQGGSGSDAGSLKLKGPHVLQQSPGAVDARSGLRKLHGRRSSVANAGAPHALAGMEGEVAGSLDDTPAVARSAHVDFEAMVEQKMREEESAAVENGEGRRECHTCGRRFAEAVLAKHQAVCAKAAASKRSPMDMRGKRLAGEAEESSASAPRRRGGLGRDAGKSRRGVLQRRAISETPVAAAGSQAQAWKRKSGALRAAMHANRVVNAAHMRGEDITKLPVFEDEHDDRVPCPHCGRKFAELTAERHIPKCQNIRAKPKFLKRGSGTAGGKVARHRSR